MTKLNLLPKNPNPYVEAWKVLSEHTSHFIITIIIVFTVGVAGGYLYRLHHDYEVRMKLMADVKERCKPVLKTIGDWDITTLYTCPDDTQYEFTERL